MTNATIAYLCMFFFNCSLFFWPLLALSPSVTTCMWVYYTCIISGSQPEASPHLLCCWSLVPSRWRYPPGLAYHNVWMRQLGSCTWRVFHVSSSMFSALLASVLVECMHHAWQYSPQLLWVPVQEQYLSTRQWAAICRTSEGRNMAGPTATSRTGEPDKTQILGVVHGKAHVMNSIINCGTWVGLLPKKRPSPGVTWAKVYIKDLASLCPKENLTRSYYVFFLIKKVIIDCLPRCYFIIYMQAAKTVAVVLSSDQV